MSDATAYRIAVLCAELTWNISYNAGGLAADAVNDFRFQETFFVLGGHAMFSVFNRRGNDSAGADRKEEKGAELHTGSLVLGKRL